MFSIGVFHFSDEALKVQGSGSANHDLTNTCVATLSVAAKSANLGGNKVARSGRQIEQNEVPKQGLKTGSFAVTHGRTPIVCLLRSAREPPAPYCPNPPSPGSTATTTGN